MTYEENGGPEVLHLTERPVPDPGPGEVRVRVHVSGVNPTDWKSRRGGGFGSGGFPSAVPNQDGAGVVDAVGPGVVELSEGQPVWLWESAWQRPDGTAQEHVVLPVPHAVPLPEGSSLDLGASLGVPAMTAHRCLTSSEDGPDRLAPGALAGWTVLVAGGAGAVGHAAVELARWAGATVVATVSSEEKAGLAAAAGAHHVVNYRRSGAADEIRSVAPGGVHVVVEVSPGVNASLDEQVLANTGTVAVYAGDETTLPVRPFMRLNARWQFVLLYTVPEAAKERAVEDVTEAAAAGALRVGASAGLPLHRYPLERTAEAHAAVEGGAVGKVLIDVA